jgi:hypothetical protein
VNQDVDAAEPFQDRPGDLVDTVRRADVGLDEQGGSLSLG